MQGGAGSWSEESLLALFPAANALCLPTVESAWRAVLDGGAAGAWIAESNTTIGELDATRDVRAQGVFLARSTYAVRHALLARPDTTLATVRRALGHPYALAQCARTLDAIAPHAERVGVIDGAHAARTLSAGDAAVASARVAERYHLDVLARSIVDDPANATTFVLLTRSR